MPDKIRPDRRFALPLCSFLTVLLSLVPLLLCTSAAFAGHYDRVYSGGSGSGGPGGPKKNGGNGDGTTTNADGSYSIGGSFHTPGSGSASYAGMIKTTFTWVEDYPGELAPNCVILTEHSIADATATADSGSGSVSCSDGLGHSGPVINSGSGDPNNPPAYSSSAHYDGTK